MLRDCARGRWMIEEAEIAAALPQRLVLLRKADWQLAARSGHWSGTGSVVLGRAGSWFRRSGPTLVRHDRFPLCAAAGLASCAWTSIPTVSIHGVDRVRTGALYMQRPPGGGLS
jgi:hypothetical protein